MSHHTAGADDPDLTPTTAGAVVPETNLLAGSGDRCVSCGVTLAVDQRYCVECGTRRGNPRFAIADSSSRDSTPSASPVSGVATGWTRLSSLLAVIAVLLALGVGVLIGHGAQTSVKQPVKVELTGGSLSSLTPAGGSSGGTAARTTPSGSAGRTTPSGSTGRTTPGSHSGTASSGTCAKGTPGCKNGKQTGNFFGS